MQQGRICLPYWGPMYLQAMQKGKFQEGLNIALSLFTGRLYSIAANFPSWSIEDDILIPSHDIDYSFIFAFAL